MDFYIAVKPSLVTRKRLSVFSSFRSLQVVIFKCQFSNSEKLEMQKLRATKSTLLRNTLKKLVFISIELIIFLKNNL